MRNNAQKHLRRGGFSGGGGNCEFEFSQKFMDRFFGGATINALACIAPALIAEEEEMMEQGGASETLCRLRLCLAVNWEQ